MAKKPNTPAKKAPAKKPAAAPKAAAPKAAKPAPTSKAAAPVAARAPKVRKFNRLLEHGTIHPPHNGAVFFQDGGYFNAAGELLFEDRPATPPKIVVDEQHVVDSATGEHSVTTTEREVDALPEADPRIILTSWLKGEVELPHDKVRSLVNKGFGESLATREEIIKYLVNTVSLVPAEIVRV